MNDYCIQFVINEKISHSTSSREIFSHLSLTVLPHSLTAGVTPDIIRYSSAQARYWADAAASTQARDWQLMTCLQGCQGVFDYSSRVFSTKRDWLIAVT